MNSFLNPLFWQQNLDFDLISNSPYSPSTFLSLTGFELRPNLNLFNCSPSSSSPNWRFQPPAPSTHLHSYCSWRFKPLTLLRLKRKYISPLIYVVSHPIYEYQNFYKNFGSDPMLGQIPEICEIFWNTVGRFPCKVRIQIDILQFLLSSTLSVCEQGIISGDCITAIAAEEIYLVKDIIHRKEQY